MAFCGNCGHPLVDGARFCFECGTRVGNVPRPVVQHYEAPGGYVCGNSSAYGCANISNRENVNAFTNVQNLVSAETSDYYHDNSQYRQQEYVGRILKCPQCGSPITERTVICPDCGLQITRRPAVMSVQLFKEQLIAIESSRKGDWGAALGFYINKADEQKLSLIRSFPIPNSIDDILEFAMLAIANIDVSMSKNTAMNRWYNVKPTENSVTISRTISNAWVSKLQQAYQKAKILFPDDPVFIEIKTMYFEKMKELRIKV